ncbi:MAG: hypothetical protein JJ975_09030 [Bacteroidia bacterium]|nr:hypothetical protein [Bacteroidia bacterium]
METGCSQELEVEFCLELTCEFTNYQLTLYDSLNNQVFTSSEPGECWSVEHIKPGNYYWKLNYNIIRVNRKKEHTGIVHVY